MKDGLFVLKHARWLHRARFLSTEAARRAESLYLATDRGKRFPYLTFAVAASGLLDTAVAATAGRVAPLTPAKFETGLRAHLERGELERFRGADPLLPALEKDPAFLWREDYCRMCAAKGCPADSVERFACHRLAYVIGALDPVETRDIFLLYRRKGESLRDCYRRIARHDGLADLLRIARPRWPDAFPPE